MLPESLAATNLAETIKSLKSEGISVFFYPLTIQLVRTRPLIGAFRFGILGPPGVYAVFNSTDLAQWSEFAFFTNTVGAINFIDTTAHSFARRFYRVQLRPGTPPG